MSMASSVPPSSPGSTVVRDVGTVTALAVALPVLGLIAVGAQWPEALWHGSLGDSQILVGAVGVVFGAVIGATLVRRPLLVQILIAVLTTAAVYAVVQGWTSYKSTEGARAARAQAARWPLLASQDYEHPSFRLPSSTDTPFGETRTELDHGRLVMVLSTRRDYTHQVGLDPRQPTVQDFYVQADVQLVEGPEDSFCGLLFGWHDNEHWYGDKIGRTQFEVTRNPGQLPHQRLDGPRMVEAIRQDRPNRMSILARGGRVSFFVNDRLVSSRQIGDTTGQVWLAAQAANTPDALRCAFDNVILRGVGP